MQKTALFFLVLMLSASLLSAQSLAELAKKEKARRAAVRAAGKKGKIVTNSDLYRPKSKAEETKRATPQAKQNQPAPKPKASTSSGIRVISDQEGGQQVDQRDDYLRNPKYGISVLPDTRMVENPEYALDRPNGRAAAISMMGLLDIEIHAANGAGADIAVYARLEGAKEMESSGEAEGIPLEAVELDWQEGFWYGVMAMNKNGEWVVLGRGLGKNSPEEFDLGDIETTDRIRIMFRPHTNPDLAQKFQRQTAKEFKFLIDAVAVLH